MQTFHAFRYQNYRWFWLGGVTESMAFGMQFLIFGWLALDITGSSFQLGLVIFGFGFSNIAVTPVGGLIADRISRLKLLTYSRIAVAILVTILAILRIWSSLEIWHVYLIVLLLGSVQGIQGAAGMAIVPDLVKRDDVMNAVALTQMFRQLGQIIGPAAGGFIIEFIGIGAALGVNAILYTLGILFLLAIRGFRYKAPITSATSVEQFKEGLQCIRSNPVLYTVIIVTTCTSFFALAYRQIMPAFATEVLAVGASETGLLLQSIAIGSLVGILVLASMGDFQKKAYLLLISLTVFSAFLILFAWSKWFWVSWVLLLFTGAASFGIFTPVAIALIQLNSPPELRGRVLSVFQIAPAAHYLGALPLAAGANLVSWQISVSVGALVSLVIALWFGLWRPVLRNVNQ